MANIKLKSLEKLNDWNSKELRKLKITLNNRLTSFQSGGRVKDLASSHVLSGLGEDSCKDLLDKVLKAEKILHKES